MRYRVRVMVEEFCYFAHDNIGHCYHDDEEFDITDFFQSNMNKVYILLEVIDWQESCYVDRNNITPSCNDEDEYVDEISDIEQNVQIISNQYKWNLQVFLKIIDKSHRILIVIILHVQVSRAVIIFNTYFFKFIIT